MNISTSLLAIGQVWFFNLLMLPLLYLIVTKVDFKALIANKGLQHRFFAATLILLIIWQINISLSLDVSIHFLGITTLTLMFAWPLALLAALIAQSGYLLLGSGQLESFALNYFINAVIPIAFTWRLHLWIEAGKPENPFVFIMGAGFLSCLLSSILVASLAGGMLFLGGKFDFRLGILDYVSYLPLFIFPEAVVNGMFISGFSILQPHWVAAFNDERYFQRPQSSTPESSQPVSKALDLNAQETQSDNTYEEIETPSEERDNSQYQPPKGWRNPALDKSVNPLELKKKDQEEDD